jgi:acetyl esterase/lipase
LRLVDDTAVEWQVGRGIEEKNMRRAAIYFTGLIMLTFFLAVSVNSQTVNIWPGVPPGTESWTQKEKVIENTPVGTVVLNVVTPTLTAYLPEKEKSTGTAVIIAPGGYCVALAISQEGDAARWFQSKGIAAFVLKYRIIEKKEEGAPKNIDMDQACKYGVADGIEAVKVVRQHASEWRISPERVGFVGFSAGGMVAAGALLQTDAAARPNFVAPIYGGPFGVMPTIPAKLPPIFMAWAQDDELAGAAVNRFYEALKAAGNKPEVHIFSSGGHGFGIKKQGTTSDGWLDEFYLWLQAQGFTKPAGK